MPSFEEAKQKQGKGFTSGDGATQDWDALHDMYETLKDTFKVS